MNIRHLLFIFGLLGCFATAVAQPTTCPAPVPGETNCYQTSRTTSSAVLPVPNTNPLWNWPPLPNQDCCNAIPLCAPVNEIENGTLLPPPIPPATTWPSPYFPGCVPNELPIPANTCFGNNEKGTTWYKFQIRPLEGGPTSIGSAAGKLRFKIIPNDVYDDPDYDPTAVDDGEVGYGETDYDFMLFKIPANAAGDGAACTAIKNSTSFGTTNSVIASCNYTGTDGPTGLFEPGTGTQAAGFPVVRFNKPISVKVGDVFYLAIDNYSTNIQGFKVDFRGLPAEGLPALDSTAVVTPPPTDSIKVKAVVNPECANKQFIVKFDAPVRCDSVKPSKFIVQGLNPPYQIVSMGPVGGCNPGGQDTAFFFTIIPDMPDTTLRLILKDEIRDICGNKVLFDTVGLRLEYPVPLVFAVTGRQPSCGISELTIQFADPVRCDSVRPSKFTILNAGVPFGQVISTRRANNLPCTGTTLDSVYVIRFSQAIKDTVNLSVALNGLILDKCNNDVKLDTLHFKINPFLTVRSTPEVVCPKAITTIRTFIDTAFGKATERDSLLFTWTNLNTGQDLEEDEFTTFTPGDSVVKIKRDLTTSELVNYRLIVQNLVNGCLDTAYTNVLFSARPDLAPSGKQTHCYGESFEYKPIINNAKRGDLMYAWFRGTGRGPNDTISKDSMLVQTVVDSIIEKGLDQTYEVVMRYIDSLGGCKADLFKVDFKYGRKIEPNIDLIEELRYASIVPAEFTFGNTSTFTPPKANAKYDWDFGQGDKKTIFGNGPATTTYLEPKPNGAGYLVSLTAYDTLYATSDLIGRICSNVDTISVFVQKLLPSLVTNNGDGVNDNFYVKGMREGSFSMKLYNRWGKLVAEQDPFKVNVADEGKGGLEMKDIGPGIYYYILTEKRSGKTLVNWLTVTSEK